MSDILFGLAVLSMFTSSAYAFAFAYLNAPVAHPYTTTFAGLFIGGIVLYILGFLVSR